LRRPRKRSKGVYRITSGNECWNRNVFRSLRKAETDGADWKSSGRVFQNMDWRLRPETSDGRLLTDGMTGRAATVWNHSSKLSILPPIFASEKYCSWRRSVVVSALTSINVVNRHWAQLVLGWVTGIVWVYNQQSRSTQPSILCGMINEYQRLGWVIINGDGGCSFLTAYRRANGSSSLLVWSKGWQTSGTVLHSSRERCELMQWLLSHNDSTINVVLVNNIIIIIIKDKWHEAKPLTWQ